MTVKSRLSRRTLTPGIATLLTLAELAFAVPRATAQSLMQEAPNYGRSMVGQLERQGPEQRARVGADRRLRFIEPVAGARSPIGSLRLRVAPPSASGGVVEMLLAWNSDPRGVTPVETCRIPLDQLVSGVILPASATGGRTGSFTIQGRVVEPFQGELSPPVDVVLFSAAPTDNVLAKRRWPAGSFQCVQ